MGREFGGKWGTECHNTKVPSAHPAVCVNLICIKKINLAGFETESLGNRLNICYSSGLKGGSYYYIQILVVQQNVHSYILIVRSKELILYVKFVQYIKYMYRSIYYLQVNVSLIISY